MARDRLTDLLSRRVVIGDGAMGTMLYEHGAFLNTCFDELNLRNPALVRQVHEGYVLAGADFIETNTFGANALKLGRFGLADAVEKINRAGVEIARETAGEEVMVAGAIGPLGRELAWHSKLTQEQAARAFAQQAKALGEAGVDFLILETFSNTQELLTAVSAVRQQSGLPMVAQMTVNEHHETIYGRKIESAIEQVAAEEGVVAVGLNCSVGPSEMLASLERIRGVTDKPISVQPNAGWPRSVDNRTLYMCTPEYMAEYAKRFLEKGAKIIGGCCGTTPEHIKEIVLAIRALDKATTPLEKVSTIAVMESAGGVKRQPAAPLAEKSRIGRKLASGEQVTSIEVTPPRGIDLSKTLERVRLCAELGVDVINIPDGPRASSRLSPMVTAIKIQQQAEIETILHFCCRDRNLIGMQSDMLGAYAIGLRNMLLVTGDPPKLGEYPNATGVFDLDSIALTDVVKNLNSGIDIGGNSFSPPIGLTIGVGANPVAADLPREIERFRQKVQAGAEYAITQPVFDVDMLFRFMEATELFKIPVIAGIWPFTSYKNAEFMANEIPGVVVPKSLLRKMSTAGTREDGMALGIEIAREMIDKTKKHVAGFAVSAPFGRVKIALAVLGKLEVKEI